MGRASRCLFVPSLVVVTGFLQVASLAACKHTGPAGGDDGGDDAPDAAIIDPPGTVDAAPSGTPNAYDVHLRTEVTGQYVSAANAGGGDVDAAAPTGREWEQWHLIDLDGGVLEHGDLVQLRAYDGASYLHVDAGGAVDARATSAGDAESFVIERVAGPGPILTGHHVALRAVAAQRYLSASNGGGGAITASAATAGAWEHFVIDGAPPDPDAPKTRVIAYLPNWYGSFAGWAGKVDFARVTHVNLAFALGDDAGNLQLAPGDQIDAFVAAAHAHGVKVFPSLCGGGGDGRIAPHYQPGVVDDFVDRIMTFVDDHHLDGIDVDVEAPGRMGAAYDTFIAKLEVKAHAKGLEVTAAVAQWMQGGMSDQTLRSFDFVNIMSYDNAGTWTGPGEHSSMAQAQEALAFYTQKGVARDRIVLGVPFYGYCWGNCGNGNAVYVLYKDILARFPDAWKSDWIDADGAKLSYNGVATLQAKTTLARGYGGIMIWELGGDVSTTAAHSLLVSVDSAP